MVRGRKKISSTSTSTSASLSPSSSNTTHHFFKVYLPAFSSKRLKIPKTFMKNLNGVAPQKFLLRGSLGRFWHVELVKVEDDFFFQDGWQGFVKDHDVQLGEILVFGYEGNSIFNVKIFDNSGCEKDEMSPDREVYNIPWAIKEEELSEAEEETLPVSIQGPKQNSGRNEKGIVKSLADEGECTELKITEVNVIEKEHLKANGSVEPVDAHFTTSLNQLNPDQLVLENVELESDSLSERMNDVRPLRTINQENAKWKVTTQGDGVEKVDLTETSSSSSLVSSDGNSIQFQPS